MNQEMQSTPPEELDRQLMDPNIPKNEREHYAAKVIAQQRDLIEKFGRIVAHARAEHTGLYFICGESGQKDKMGLPEHIFVCPAHGLDGSCTYQRVTEYSAPGW